MARDLPVATRDATLWCRELQVQAGYRLLGTLAGMNHLYFTTFQVKRVRRFAARLHLAPAHFACRLEAALMAEMSPSFAMRHELEHEVLSLAAARWPDLDLTVVRKRHATFEPTAAGNETARGASGRGQAKESP